jgi:hypothetical protein
MASSSTPFTMPLPKLPMAELVARVRESLDKMDKQEAEEKQRREALEEKRWRERCNERSNTPANEKSPLFVTWASVSSAGASPADDERLEPLKADAVGSSSPVKIASPATDFNSAGPPSQGTYQAGATAAAAPKDIIPEEELMRRRKVEAELIALSNKITEEKLRKERMVPLVWDKPTFDPFSSAAAAAEGSSAAVASSRSTSQGEKLESKGGQGPNPRKRRNGHDDEGKKPYRNLNAIGVPPQARAYYTRDEPLYGGGGFGIHRPTQEEIEDFVAFVNEWMPSDPNWRKRFEADEEEIITTSET